MKKLLSRNRKDPFTDGKLIKTRKMHQCIYSGNYINSGEKVYALKIFPSEAEIDIPTTVYACGTCGECTH